MVIVHYQSNGKTLFDPRTPLQAILIAEAHCRAVGLPHLSPLAVIKSAGDRDAGEAVTGLFSGTKLTLKELLPGLRLRAGVSEIEIVRVRPTEREVTYKTHNQLVKMDSEKFLNLANQQGYRKIWDIKTFLTTLKTMLKPILAPIPLMWVLHLVSDAVRKKPIKYEGLIPVRDDAGKLSSTKFPHHHHEDIHDHHLG